MSQQKTVLCLIRHGETSWNTEGRIQGIMDIPLSSAGEWQAMQVARQLKSEHLKSKPQWSRVYSSHLSRAYVTAEVIAKALRIPHLVDERLRERGYGKLEGKTRKEIDAEYPEFSYHKDLANADMEQMTSMRERICACLTEIADRHPGEHILVVSHGAALRAFLQTIAVKEPLFLGNTSRTQVERDQMGWNIVYLNDLSHLDDADRKSV